MQLPPKPKHLLTHTALPSPAFLPRGAAWVAVATAANEAHPVVECSNKGVCNRRTGTCACFANYDGIACERTVCPNDCSQNGICYTQKMLAEEASKTCVRAGGVGGRDGVVSFPGPPPRPPPPLPLTPSHLTMMSTATPTNATSLS